MAKNNVPTLSNVRKNSLGTISFEAQFQGMRKAQDFVCYPIATREDGSRVLIQSDTRIGYLYTNTGEVHLSPPVSGGAYNHHLPLAKKIDTLDQEQLLSFKSAVFATANKEARTSAVEFDNSGAKEVFGTAKAPELERSEYEKKLDSEYGPVRNLLCPCCGGCTQGRQWANQDIGYGLCNDCIDRCSARVEDMKRTYGMRGIHYGLTIGQPDSLKLIFDILNSSANSAVAHVFVINAITTAAENVAAGDLEEMRKAFGENFPFSAEVWQAVAIEIKAKLSDFYTPPTP